MSRFRNFPVFFYKGATFVAERSVKNTSGSRVSGSLVYCVDSQLVRVTPHTGNEDGFVKSSIEVDILSPSVPLFYPLKESTYTVVHYFIISDGKLVRNSVSLLLPSRLEKRNLLYLDASLVFDKQVRQVLASNNVDFVLARSGLEVHESLTN